MRMQAASTAGGAFAPACGTLAGELASDKLYFCNGPHVVNPFFAPYPLPGSCFCTGSAQGCRLMVLEEERAGPI